MRILLLTIMLFLYCGCESTFDKLDGEYYNRETEQWESTEGKHYDKDEGKWVDDEKKETDEELKEMPERRN